MSKVVYIYQDEYTDKVNVFSSFKKCFEHLVRQSKNEHSEKKVRMYVKQYYYDGGDCCMYSQEVL